jgi:hypothetical protein
VKHGIRTFEQAEKTRLSRPSELDYFDVEVDFAITSLHDLRFVTRVRLYKRPVEAVKVVIAPTLIIRLRQDDVALVENNTRILSELNASKCYFLTDFCRSE